MNKLKEKKQMEVNTTMDVEQLKALRTELTRFMMNYKFGLDEVSTKVNILKQEFERIHDYNPIEHVESRIKSPQSIMNKIYRKGYEFSLPSIKENIQDIAGIRIVCSFISDIYKLSDMLTNQDDITVIKCKDYIKNPKPNGYKSLHLVLQVPVFMSDRVENVCVEVQIRTIAMDFWASLEHKIFYKYDKKVPQRLLDELKNAAESAAELDSKMENISNQMNKFKKAAISTDEIKKISINNEEFYFPEEFWQI